MIMSLYNSFLFLTVLFLNFYQNSHTIVSSQKDVTVKTKLGYIQGTESIFLNEKVRSFLSVPFAEPPIGDLRFKPPVTKKPWNNTLRAKKLSPACFQNRDTYNESFWGSEMWNANTEISEDCLYMNIWAPASAHNLTVMVWLFGGGFSSGSPSLILYDGKALALQGNVVVININYRLGPFGFLYLDHEDAPGNVGMLDQQLAFKWIKDNVVHFGGNPNQIALFGESAGASSIMAHLIAPGSKGIFKNGILQSGSLDNKWSMDTPQRGLDKSTKLVNEVQCNRSTIEETLQCMRNVSPGTLVDNMWSITSYFLEFPLVIISKDRNFFRKIDAFDALRNKQYDKDINLMIGINHDEGNYWNIYNLKEYFDKAEQPLISLDEFNECIDTAFKDQSSLVRNSAKKVYGTDDCKLMAQGRHKFFADQINQMVGDYFFTCDSLWFADQYEHNPGKVYVYYFDQPSSANPWPTWTGVMHGYEIEYVFGVPIYNDTAGYTKREYHFSQKIIQFWTSFSATGKPTLKNGNKHDKDWPPYRGGYKWGKWMNLKAGSHMYPINAKKGKECHMWREVKDMEYKTYKLSRSLLINNSSQYKTNVIFLIMISSATFIFKTIF
uniref:Carboxylic ester hydrolase n=2 Tax=Strongyloides stercoralis TaxID=6248 RepID=A0AAF5I4B6_STRER